MVILRTEKSQYTDYHHKIEIQSYLNVPTIYEAWGLFKWNTVRFWAPSDGAPSQKTQYLTAEINWDHDYDII
jgi:hypothetical protein